MRLLIEDRPSVPTMKVSMFECDDGDIMIRYDEINVAYVSHHTGDIVWMAVSLVGQKTLGAKGVEFVNDKIRMGMESA